MIFKSKFPDVEIPAVALPDFVLARAVLVVLNVVALLLGALTWLMWPLPPENPFDYDPLGATALFVAVWAALSTLTTVLTTAAVRLRRVDNTWWIMVPVVLLLLAITAGILLRAGSDEYFDPTAPTTYGSAPGLSASDRAGQ